MVTTSWKCHRQAEETLVCMVICITELCGLDSWLVFILQAILISCFSTPPPPDYGPIRHSVPGNHWLSTLLQTEMTPPFSHLVPACMPSAHPLLCSWRCCDNDQLVIPFQFIYHFIPPARIPLLSSFLCWLTLTEYSRFVLGIPSTKKSSQSFFLTLSLSLL